MINYKELTTKYLEDRKSIGKKHFPATFMDSSLGLLQQIPLVRVKGKVSATQTLKGLNGGDLAEVVKFFYHVTPTTYMDVAKKPGYGSFTPLAMYAHKLYHGVKYEEWDKEDSYLEYMLGSGLGWLLKVPDVRDYILANVQDLRVQARELKNGEIMPLTGYKIGTPVLEGVDFPNPNFWRMVLQFWIANSEKRFISKDGTSSMILDPWDWDLVPDVLDAETPELKSIGDLPF